ncbi:MAG: hypothetical protein DMF58_08950, partial [Acidobacteria bacterium]
EKHGKKMMRLVARADRAKLRKQGVRFEIKPWKDSEILWEKCVPEDGAELGPENLGETPHHIRRTGQIVPMKMTDYGVFAAKEREDVPYAFLIDATAQNVAANLLTHGVVLEKLTRETTFAAEQFVIRDTERSEHAFQGHNELTLTGKWKSRDETFPAGTYVVRMNQPLGRLAFYLLDPRSDDGLFDWNFFDSMLDAKVAPVRRITKPAAIDATIVSEK